MTARLSKLNLALRLCLTSSLMLSAQAFSYDNTADSDSEPKTNKEKQKEKDIEVIVVSGTRSSLQEAALLKREANNFKEVVTVEDIGQLPDDSIAASLQRLTGVGVVEDRGQPMQVLVRGLSSDLTLTTFNGREVASEQGGRGVNLGLFPGDILRRASIDKSTSASMIEGGLAGTVSLETARPLNVQKRVLSFNAKHIDADVQGGPEVITTGQTASLTYIDKNAEETFGVSAAIAYQNRPIVSQAIFNPSSQPNAPIPVLDINSPKGFGDMNGDDNGDGVADNTVDFFNRNNFQQAEAYTNEQVGGAFTFQLQATDDTLITADAVFSRSKREGIRSRADFVYVGNTAYDNVNSSDADIGFDYTQAGDMVNGALVTSYDLTNGSPRFSGVDMTEYFDSTILGINVEHYLTDDWVLEADVSYSNAGRNGYNATAKIMTRGESWSFALDDDDVPQFYNFGFGQDPENPMPGVILADNLTWGNNVAEREWRPVTLEYLKNFQDDELNTAKIGAQRYFDDGIITNLKFGARVSKRTKAKSRETELFNDAGLSFARDGGTLEESLEIAQASLYDSFPFGEFMPGVASLNQWPVLKANDILEYRFGAGGIEASEVWQRDLFVETYDVDETSASAFVQVDFEGEFANMPFRGNAGVRYVHTETTARSAIPEYAIETDENGEVIEVNIADFDRDYSVLASTNEYDNWLPSFNIVFEPTDDLLVRFAAGQAMSRPTFAKLGKTTKLETTRTEEGDVDIVVLMGETGNAALDAILSTQLDLALEWYPTEDLSLSVGGFVKEVEGFFVTGQKELTLASNVGDNLGDPVTFLLEQPQNDSKTSTITGIELSYAQAFTFLPGFLSGLGMTANYTHLSSDIDNEFILPYFDGDTATPNGTTCLSEEPEASGRICSAFGLPPNGFAEHTFNSVLYYDSYPVNVRLAYRYQTEASHLGEDLDNNIMMDPVEKVDLTAHYSFTRNFRISAAINNLTDEVRRLYWADPWGTDSTRATNRYQTHGRTFSVFARYKF